MRECPQSSRFQEKCGVNQLTQTKLSTRTLSDHIRHRHSPTSGSRTLGVGSAASMPMNSVLPVSGQIVVPFLLDACFDEFTPAEVEAIDVPMPDSLPLEIFLTETALREKKIALIINANGCEPVDYWDLASHLAREGIITAIATRPSVGLSDDASFVLDALNSALDELGIDPDDPLTGVALVGHSSGEDVAIEATKLNAASDRVLPITVVAGFASDCDEGVPGRPGLG